MASIVAIDTTTLTNMVDRLTAIRQQKAEIEKIEKELSADVKGTMKAGGLTEYRTASGNGFKIVESATYTLPVKGLRAGLVLALAKIGCLSFTITPFRESVKNGALPAADVAEVESRIQQDTYEKLIKC
jgi:hypothetical protein